MKNINVTKLKEIALNRATTRTYFAIGLLVISLLAAIAITGKANQSVTVWAASSEIMPGDEISNSNIRAVKVFLPESINEYMSSRNVIHNGISNRRIASGELIPRRAVSVSFAGEATRSVPLRIARNDLPNDLTSGQVVDIYYLPQANLNSTKAARTELISEAVLVESIDQKSKDMGGEIGIVLKIPEFEVMKLLAALNNSRVVVVRSAI
jgi:hypothetical protein